MKCMEHVNRQGAVEKLVYVGEKKAREAEGDRKRCVWTAEIVGQQII